MPGLTLHAGLSGAGKTFAMREEVFAFARTGGRVICLDSEEEWTHVPPDISQLGVRGCQTVKSATEFLSKGGRIAIVRMGMGEAALLAEQAAEWACTVKGSVGLAVPEAHDAWPKAFPKEGAYFRRKVVTAWRHRDVECWMDTQRFALLNTSMCELATTVRLFAMTGPNDMKRLNELGGKPLIAAIRRCAQKLSIHRKTKDPSMVGWHVELDLDRTPPFDIRRFGSDEVETVGKQSESDFNGDDDGQASESFNGGANDRGDTPDDRSLDSGEDR